MKAKEDKFINDINVRRNALVHSCGIGYETILTRHLTETEACHDWRIRNFAPMTKSLWQKAISTIQRIFIDSKGRWSASDTTNEYLNAKKFDNLSFEQFIQQRVVPVMMEDPNAWLVWIPLPKYDNEGNIVIMQNVDLKPVIVTSDQKVECENEDGEEKYIVYNYGFLEQEDEHGDYDAIVRHKITEDYFAIQVFARNELDYAETIIYTHRIGRVPYLTLGGIWHTDGYYISYFDSFIHIGNEALRQYSDNAASMSINGFPTKVVSHTECQDCGGTGYIDFRNSKGIINKQTCGKCQGGTIAPTSPLSVVVRKDGFSTEKEPPVIEYISPPVDILKYSGEAWQVLLKYAEDSLNLTHTLEAQSGKAKEVDRDTLYAFISQISNNVYDNIIYNSLWIIEHYLVIANPLDPTVIRPTNFKIVESGELYLQYKDAFTSNIDKSMVSAYYLEYIDKYYNCDALQNKIATFKVMYDAILCYNVMDKIALLQAGIITRETLDFSISLSSNIEKLKEQYDYNYIINASYEELYKKIIEIWKPHTTESIPNKTTELI